MGSRVFRPPPLGKLRLARVDDAPTIVELLNDSMARNFRVGSASDVVYLIENCVLTICQLDLDDVMVGCLALRDYPLIPSVHPSAWEEYIWTKYKAIELNSRNTLFVHLFCWHAVYARELVDNMLKSVFMHDPYVQHIGMVKSLVQYPLLVPGQSRTEASFRRVTSMEKGMSGDQLPCLCIADRKEVQPRLRIRRAVEEDNDDIVPIIEAHSPRLRELYGEFYVSELISRHPDSERVLLVCEHKEVAVGVMCLNTQINFEALEENFELSPFVGLRKPDKKPLQMPKDQDSNVSFFVATCPNTGADYNDSRLCSFDSTNQPKDMKSRITWILEEESAAEESTDTAAHFKCPSQMDILPLLDDEDELEFDIINIDTDLLRVPELLSYDSLEQGIAENISKILNLKRKDATIEDKKKEKQKICSASSVHKSLEPTRYSGPSNAFVLELFAMNRDYDERYGFDMLEGAYEMFPDRDYCIVCLPSNQPPFPLLEHFTLVTPFASRMRFINESLYVAHLNSVRGDIKVRPGEAFDMSGLLNIVEHAPRLQTIVDLFETALTSHTLQCYAMTSENQPIGVVVLGPLENGASVRAQYDLEAEPRRPGTDGMILAGIVSPAFEPHSRWFIRELLRLSQYSTLFWVCRLFAKGDARLSRNLMSLGGHMVPVRPRNAVPNLSGDKELDRISGEATTPCALWMIERPLSSLPKVNVNNSIVVVGASRTGLAFLETIFMGPTSHYLTFSNVTLVSEHGLPTVSECLRAADTCVPREGRYTDRYIKSVPFYYYVDVMAAVMVGIDRKKKCIQLKGGGVKFYDELVLTCGQQYQHPDYLHDSLLLAKDVEMGKPCERLLMDDPKYQRDRVPQSPAVPHNLMLINSLFEANLCLRKLLCMITDLKDTNAALSINNQVIVYGDCIDAYSCMAALLELGLAAELITFVEPYPPHEHQLRVNCFNNETVDERVQSKLEELGIRVYRRYHLTGWQAKDTRLESVHLLSQLKAVSLKCFALFFYGIKAIDVNAFRAINQCGLVYDGGVVVSASFETNDPSVFGAGACVKYSRRLYANARAQRYYCTEDVGEALARLFLKKLDPFVMCSDDSTDDVMPRFSSSLLAFKESQSSLSSLNRVQSATTRWQPVLKFESPLVISATLPGPLYYMKTRKPGAEIPMEVQMCLPHQGHILITDRHHNYFRLHLNVLHCVEGVTCLAHTPFCTDVLAQLFGKHEAFFGKLLARYQLGQIEDLYEYFSQPWLSAEYQETFSQLLYDINHQDVGRVYDLVKYRFKIYDKERKSSRAMSMAKSTCSTVSSCMDGPKEGGLKLGTFRSVLNRHVASTSSLEMVNSSNAVDIPSECGQSEAIRREAADFWRKVGGERIVISHLAKYLLRNSFTNPHYAAPKADLPT